MMFSRYKRSLIIFAIYLALSSTLFLSLIPPFGGTDLSPLIYGKGAIELLLIFMVFWPIVAIIGGFLVSYLFVPLFLFIHKKIIGRNMIYGIEEVQKSEKFTKIFRGLFPALMSINFSLLLASNQGIIEFIINYEKIPSGVATSMLSLLILSIPTIGLAMALFSPVWFLLDAGIVYSNQEKIVKKSLEEPVEGRTLGGWYMHFLKGYAGIGTIFSYYLLILLFIAQITRKGEIISTPQLIQVILNSFIFVPLFLLIAISAIPAIILLDITTDFRIKYVKRWAKKLGITTKVEIIFKEIK